MAHPGPELHAISKKLKTLPGVEQAAAFGNDLHVSGRNVDQLARSVRDTIGPEHRAEEVETSLEEVFIDLMRRSQTT